MVAYKIIEFEIPDLPKTINALGRAHWAVKAQEAAKWKALVHLSVCAYKPEKPLEKARITLTRYSSGKPDFDGLVSSFKHVLDGLIEAGVIIDDSMDNVTTEYAWERAQPKKGKIHIRVEPLT